MSPSTPLKLRPPTPPQSFILSKDHYSQIRPKREGARPQRAAAGRLGARVRFLPLGGCGGGGEGGPQASLPTAGKPRVRACACALLPQSVTFAFRFPLKPAPSCSRAVSQKARGGGSSEQLGPSRRAPALLFWEVFQELDTAACPSAPLGRRWLLPGKPRT